MLRYASAILYRLCKYAEKRCGYQRIDGARMQFFKEHPKLRGLFFHSILHTPNHLLEKVNEVKKDLNAFNAKVYWEYLKHLEIKSFQGGCAYVSGCLSECI